MSVPTGKFLNHRSYESFNSSLYMKIKVPKEHNTSVSFWFVNVVLLGVTSINRFLCFLEKWIVDSCAEISVSCPKSQPVRSWLVTPRAHMYCDNDLRPRCRRFIPLILGTGIRQTSEHSFRFLKLFVLFATLPLNVRSNTSTVGELYYYQYEYRCKSGPNWTSRKYFDWYEPFKKTGVPSK